MKELINLHVHTDHSVLDGMCKISELVEKAKQLNQSAIAITDHGSMCGVLDLFKECKKHNVQPIYGIEFYHTMPNYTKRFHLCAYAKSQGGLRNLYELHKISHTQTVNGRPTITLDDLVKHKEDIVISTACIAGIIPHLLLNDKIDELSDMLVFFTTHFGDDFYLELQANTISEQKYVNENLLKLATKFNLKYIITNDTHYIQKNDAKVHEILLCIQTQKKLADPKHFVFPSNDFWLKTSDEMYKMCNYLTENQMEQAIDNTHEIANKCKFDLQFPTSDECLPKYNDEEIKTLRKMTTEGWKRKKPKNKEAEKRVRYELDVIEQKGYSGYYLIVQDYINYAKSSGITVGDGRGSGVGSVVAYLLNMTTVNPMDYGLLFERFLNPERFTSPDYDCDFADRDTVIQYLQNRWGKDNVSTIVARGKLTARALIRKVMSVNGHSMAEINIIAKSLPKKLDLLLEDCHESAEFSSFISQHPDQYYAMQRLEGTIDHLSKHAGGVLITPYPIVQMLPLLYDNETNMYVSGFDKYQLEELGLYKFDILGLIRLQVVDETIRNIKLSGKDFSLDDIDYTDKKVYDMLCKGDVFGVFQLDAQAHLTKLLAPQNEEDLIALNALIRPGVGDIQKFVARKNGEDFEYYHDDEKAYMASTYNIITYQEQIMLRVNTLAGWSLGKGDSLRKHKKIKYDKEIKKQYVKDCLKIGKINVRQAFKSWSEIVTALDGGYSFNKSHACSYAKLAFQTAHLKLYYPKEFMAALMTSKKGEQESIAEQIQKCKEYNVQILPPDINKSNETFSCEQDGIRFSLNTIKQVGENVYNHLLTLRPIINIEDMFNRRNTKILKKNIIINLINAGAFDYYNKNRYEVLAEFYDLLKQPLVAEEFRKKTFEVDDICLLEQDSLGMNLTASPFDMYNFKPLSSYVVETCATSGGQIIACKQIFDKNNKPMAFLTILNQHNTFEVVVFAKVFAKYEKLLKQNNIIMVSGTLKENNKILADKITMLKERMI